MIHSPVHPTNTYGDLPGFQGVGRYGCFKKLTVRSSTQKGKQTIPLSGVSITGDDMCPGATQGPLTSAVSHRKRVKDKLPERGDTRAEF